MNFDNIKSAWNNDNTNDVNIPTSLEKLRAAKHPLDKLKKNMKKEWYSHSISLVLLAFVPQIFNLHPDTYSVYYAFYGMLAVISIYYLNLFRKFYNELLHFTADTKDSLDEIYYHFRLNIERYHSFSFLLLPYVLMLVGVMVYTHYMQKGVDISTALQQSKTLLIVITLVVSTFFIIIIPVWTSSYFGKYLKQIKRIREELKES